MAILFKIYVRARIKSNIQKQLSEELFKNKYTGVRIHTKQYNNKRRTKLTKTHQFLLLKHEVLKQIVSYFALCMYLHLINTERYSSNSSFCLKLVNVMPYLSFFKCDTYFFFYFYMKH